MRLFLFQHFETVLGLCLGFLLIARILRQHYRPSVSIAWLLAIVLIPYVGVPAYLLFGGRKLMWLAGKKPRLYAGEGEEPQPEGPLISRMERVLVASGTPRARRHNCVDFVPSGDETYAALVSLIEKAKESIHMATFILGCDSVARSIVDLLCRKAAEGVEVRLLLDALGSLRSRGRFVNRLREANGRVGIFLPVLPLRRKWSANLRNHRKMVIIDGRAALLGGMNIAAEYMGPTPNPKRWLDTASIITGAAVNDLEAIFAKDWMFATGETLEARRRLEESACDESGCMATVQIAASGPDTIRDAVYEALLAATFEARRRIWIVSPYFVPDETLLQALLLQARLGCDVRIVLPERSNHLLADVARGRFLRDLKAAGAKVFLHRGCMIHGKHVVFDDEIAMAGSLNLDMRSLYLNYEVAMFLLSRGEVTAIADWMDDLIKRSEEISVTEPGCFQNWAEDLSLLVSPLL
ncbi:MAG: cardiolipin synthase [Candidatus Sumerlaeota bacterium]|nr:cardiolipin synthase [Candidatus Sumerlaeota bacterium]